MSGRIVKAQRQVVRGSDDPILDDHDSADRDFAFVSRAGRFFERKAHRGFAKGIALRQARQAFLVFRHSFGVIVVHRCGRSYLSE